MTVHASPYDGIIRQNGPVAHQARQLLFDLHDPVQLKKADQGNCQGHQEQKRPSLNQQKCRQDHQNDPADQSGRKHIVTPYFFSVWETPPNRRSLCW